MVVSKTDTLDIRAATDVVLIRQKVRTWSAELGLSLVDQTKMITAASELARNLLDYGGRGFVRLESVENGSKKGLRLTFEDKGPGIPDLELAHYGRLYDRKRIGTRLRRGQTTRPRVRDRVQGW